MKYKHGPTVGQLEKHLAKVKNKNDLVLICEADPSLEFDNTGLAITELPAQAEDNQPSDGPGGVYYILVKGLES